MDIKPGIHASKNRDLPAGRQSKASLREAIGIRFVVLRCTLKPPLLAIMLVKTCPGVSQVLAPNHDVEDAADHQKDDSVLLPHLLDARRSSWCITSLRRSRSIGGGSTISHPMVH